MERKPLVKNASSKRQVKDAARKERLRDENELDDLKKILQTYEGRRVVWKLLSYCGIFRLSVEHSGSMTYYNEGRREVGLYLLKEITTADQNLYIQMMKENMEKF
jgi:hypothetical protein